MNATILWLWSGTAGAIEPDAELIRRTASEVVRRPEFRLAPPQDRSAAIRYLLQLLRDIFDFLGSLWSISPVLACAVVVVLVAAIVALVVHIIYVLRSAWVGESPGKGGWPAGESSSTRHDWKRRRSIRLNSTTTSERSDCSFGRRSCGSNNVPAGPRGRARPTASTCRATAPRASSTHYGNSST